MHYQIIAKIINTHGIKGEVKLLCNYQGKHFQGWKANMNLYFYDNSKNSYCKLIVNSLRTHKNYLLVTFFNFNTIDEVLFLKNKVLLIATSVLASKTNNIIWQDLKSYQVQMWKTSKVIGTIINFYDNNHSGLWEIKTSKNCFLLPNLPYFIKEIDEINRICYIILISGLVNDEIL